MQGRRRLAQAFLSYLCPSHLTLLQTGWGRRPPAPRLRAARRGADFWKREGEMTCSHPQELLSYIEPQPAQLPLLSHPTLQKRSKDSKGGCGLGGEFGPGTFSFPDNGERSSSARQSRGPLQRGGEREPWPQHCLHGRSGPHGPCMVSWLEIISM